MTPYSLLQDEFEIRDVDGYAAQRHLSNQDRRVFVRRAQLTAAPANAAVRAAREQLYAMGQEPDTGLTHRRIHNSLRLLSALTDEASLAPILTPDENGGITFEWIAAPRHLTLELDNDGTFVFSEVDEAGNLADFREGRVATIPLPSIAHRVAAFSTSVTPHNPPSALNR